MKSQQSGFTLVEIAIVLVIIGLLLGGILKGQELINSAKVKNLANDFRTIPTYIYGYQDKFKSLPGDDAAASTHITGATVATTGGTVGNGVIEGNWNSATTTDESYLFWQHVRLANLAAGPTRRRRSRLHPQERRGRQARHEQRHHRAAADLRHERHLPDLLGRHPRQVREAARHQMDDGNTATGSMRAVAGGAALGTAGVLHDRDRRRHVVHRLLRVLTAPQPRNDGPPPAGRFHSGCRLVPRPC